MSLGSNHVKLASWACMSSLCSNGIHSHQISVLWSTFQISEECFQRLVDSSQFWKQMMVHSSTSKLWDMKWPISVSVKCQWLKKVLLETLKRCNQTEMWSKKCHSLSHLCLSWQKQADVCSSHPVLWVTAMNVELSFPFLTSDWVLSKLLLFSTHHHYSTSLSHSALFLREYKQAKRLKSQGKISYKMGEYRREKRMKWRNRIEDSAEKHITTWKAQMDTSLPWRLTGKRKHERLKTASSKRCKADRNKSKTATQYWITNISHPSIYDLYQKKNACARMKWINKGNRLSGPNTAHKAHMIWWS